MEAGNRSFDWRVPEETNRRIIDHVSDVNLAYTEHARSNLLREGIHPQRIYVTGSPMFEVLTHYRSRIDASDVLEREKLTKNGYVIVSLHREENVDDAHRLGAILEGVSTFCAARELEVVVSTHPRTLKRLEESGLLERFRDVLRLAKPFGFHDYNKLQIDAACALSDSGTISEEASILGFAAVTPREWIERPEALVAGSVVMSGLETEAIMRSLRFAADAGAPTGMPDGLPGRELLRPRRAPARRPRSIARCHQTLRVGCAATNEMARSLVAKQCSYTVRSKTEPPRASVRRLVRCPC